MESQWMHESSSWAMNDVIADQDSVYTEYRGIRISRDHGMNDYGSEPEFIMSELVNNHGVIWRVIRPATITCLNRLSRLFVEL